MGGREGEETAGWGGLGSGVRFGLGARGSVGHGEGGARLLERSVAQLTQLLCQFLVLHPHLFQLPMQHPVCTLQPLPFLLPPNLFLTPSPRHTPPLAPNHLQQFRVTLSNLLSNKPDKLYCFFVLFTLDVVQFVIGVFLFAKGLPVANEVALGFAFLIGFVEGGRGGELGVGAGGGDRGLAGGGAHAVA